MYGAVSMETEVSWECSLSQKTSLETPDNQAKSTTAVQELNRDTVDNTVDNAHCVSCT